MPTVLRAGRSQARSFRRRRAAAALASLAAASPACRSATGPATEEITGTVAGRAPSGSDLVPLEGARRVSGAAAGADGRLFLRVEGAVLYVRGPGGTLRRATAAALAPGAAVRAWPTGAELRSNPPQYPVRRVDITPPAP